MTAAEAGSRVRGAGRRPAMGDWWAVVVAAAAVLGALAPRTGASAALAAAAAAALAALATRRPLLLVAGVYALASVLSQRAWAGLEPAPAGPVDGVAALAGDPERFGDRVRVDLRIGGRRLEAWAGGDSGAAIASRLAGERVRVRGTASAPGPDERRRMHVRHVAGRLQVTHAVPAGRAGPVAGTANGARRVLTRGAAPLSPAHRSLFTGIVLGDDRGQPPEMEDDFRGAGLSHLLAVSGQNVAFVLALLAPLLQRLAPGGRLALGAVALVTFGVLTRWEPSVLRAVVMTALVLAAAARGLPQPGLRVLGLAVAGLVLVDPLLVHRAGFLLSVGACAGIVVLARPLEARVPGPPWLRQPLAVTLAAQVGVAPILVPLFGPLPLASVPANLLAVPVAGPLMMWGMTAGLVAGVGGDAVAAAVHAPTAVMLAWIAGVARVAAAAPLGRVTPAHLGAVAAAALLIAGARRRARRANAPGPRPAVPAAAATALAAVAAGTALFAAVRIGNEPLSGTAHGRGSGTTVWSDARVAVVVTDGSDRTASMLAVLRRRNVRRPDVLVVTGGGRTAAANVGPVVVRHRPRLVLAAEGVVLPGATAVTGPAEARAGPYVVAVAPDGRRLRVVVQHRRATVAADARPPR